MNDKPIHLSAYLICDKQPYAEPSVTVPIWVTQSSLDGIQALIRFCEGMNAAGHGEINGSFELVMFHRTLRGCIDKAEKEESAKHDPEPIV
jgi:hypothetical protein